ncbi:tripartite tricarboxylate transporter substrate binding protein [Ramlibacter sp. AW1]|uniref:Tripartite tricarboxylate transporter substrate binding protein n=1 Tax=Ramlibacter aurantiacus TaxID=2801330 RepID=A0A937D8E8_9BURK|nr:tripartite tricarboxylate transporter substrate-binding protein [Ramlibacter aurantiacus]MBL0422001.1 tripartite tricarboxylate transporter substrate binding protein [Ramlibacter aurantiacus]
MIDRTAFSRPSGTRRLLLALAVAAPLAAWSQGDAGRISIVVPFPAGAGPDLAARLIADKLGPRIGQTVIVENRPGVGGLAGAGVVARSRADGHTLLLAPSTLAISPHVLPKGAGGGIDVLNDLAPVLKVGTTPMLLVANPDAGIRNVQQLLAAGKTKELAYGSAGNGSPMHFAGAMLQKSTGLKLMHIPYKGAAPSVVAAMSGEVPLLVSALGGVSGQLRSGKLVAIAVTEPKRTTLLPDVPTLAEAGVKDVVVSTWYGLFTRAGTPDATIARLNQEVNAVLKMPDVREKLETAGIEVTGGTPQELRSAMVADHERYGRIARELSITAD